MTKNVLFRTKAALFAAGLLGLSLLLGARRSSGAVQKEEEEEQAVPASEEASSAETFGGAVPGTDAFVAVVTSPENNVLAYVCDNERIAEWFLGGVEDGSLDLTTNSGARLHAGF